jgi:hypothetical protein
VIHGTAGDKLDLATLTPPTGQRSNCASPPCCRTCRHACAPICCRCCTAISNISRTCARRFAVNERLLDIEHREWMICLGRGFDFLHTPNIALIIGPYSPNLDVPIRRAAGIIEANMHAGRIPDDGFLLLASVPYDEIGVDRARAELKSRFLSTFAADVIRAEFPAPWRTDDHAHRGARLALANPGDDRGQPDASWAICRDNKHIVP